MNGLVPRPPASLTSAGAWVGLRHDGNVWWWSDASDFDYGSVNGGKAGDCLKLTSAGWEIEDCSTRLPFFCSELPAGGTFSLVLRNFLYIFFDIQTNVRMLARGMDSVTMLLVLVRVSRDGKAKTAATFTAPTSTTVPVMERAWGRINVVAELAGRHGTYNWYFFN